MNNQTKINKIAITNDTISGRGGLTLFMRYLEGTLFFPLINEHLGHLKKSKKGLGLKQFVMQLMAFFIDGTDMSISGFDRKRNDDSYTAVLENRKEDMASSHQMKRFFSKFSVVGNFMFRKILTLLFLWRLKLEQPAILFLQADTMVLDNDDAKKREGCEPTYKKKKGFQPLHLTWGPYLIDALFRSGSKHSNHGKDFIKAVERIVKVVRKHYKDVPIILNTDSGFMSEENFEYFEQELRIHYVCTGRLYDDIKEYLKDIAAPAWSSYQNGKASWDYVDFGNKLKSWEKMRRCIFTTMASDEKGQLLFQFARPDNIIYTNLGTDKELDRRLIECGGEDYLTASGIIGHSHQRGKDELIHRSLKELATKEQLPFEKMHMNRAYYYFMVLSHFMLESYKRDVLKDVLAVVSYPNTVRRKFIDFAVKIVSHGGQLIMKVTKSVYDNLQIAAIWELCCSPPKISIV